MIKANELRIGNKLIYGINPDPAQNIIVTVKTIGEDGINHQIIEDHPDEGTMQFVEKFEYEYLSGIPITPEILINKWPNAIKGARVYVMDGDLEGHRLKQGHLMIWVTYFEKLIEGRPPVKCDITDIVTEEAFLDKGHEMIAVIKSKMVKP